MARRFKRISLALVMLLWPALAVAQNADDAAPSVDAVDLDPAETTEAPDIDTGQHGTSSGLTRSDMNEPDEGSGSGQSQGDDLFQTPAAASDAGPAYETQTPEPDEPAGEQPLPDDPMGAQEEGRQESGETQSSNEDSP